MKKLFLFAIAAAGMMTAQAQQALEAPSFWSNWSVGIEGGGITPLYDGSSFIGDMRGAFGVHIQKQVSPVFGLGVEAFTGVNTSSWGNSYAMNAYGVKSGTVFDNSYVGAYGTINFMNLFGGFKCDGPRVFEIEAQAGAGWGHDYMNNYVDGLKDHNYFATKAGLNFNFNVNRNLTLSIKPAVIWDMSDADVAQSTAAYNKENATFQIFAGVSYKFGEGFKCVDTKNQAEIDALNAQINALRADLAACNAATAAAAATAADLANQLQACQNRKPEVIKEVSNNLQSVRYIFYKIGSSVITADQMPNVEMVASYMKNHKNSTVVVKGYASQDGNLDFNIKLAQARAESVKNALIKKYGISADRIKAEGEGIGHMFTENDWNRVSICTLD
ncbi:MAG: OmpA family protein [Firmicutes bacterium]|nr:OmpA family protein [Bacillota bacterium]MCM1401618.1 OmpA family protein [Bacteroides sp.]MCM1477763.1 OmpA family protein [Bacteroides sp.]